MAEHPPQSESAPSDPAHDPAAGLSRRVAIAIVVPAVLAAAATFVLSGSAPAAAAVVVAALIATYVVSTSVKRSLAGATSSASLFELLETVQQVRTSLPDFVDSDGDAAARTLANRTMQPIADEVHQLRVAAADLVRARSELVLPEPDVTAVAEEAPAAQPGVAAAPFVDLGRRAQDLINEQIRHIEAMEQHETNADTLERLFRIDHLASRARRNAASILVLAGRASAAPIDRPIPMHHVVQAACGSVQHFDRIVIGDVTDLAIGGHVAADLAHLLAELLENATTAASAGSTMVQARATDDGLVIQINDQGLGIDPELLAQANQQLTTPGSHMPALEAIGAHGLRVSAELAARHELRVQLVPVEAGGIAALVQVPASVVTQAPEAPAPAEQPIVEPLADATAAIDESGGFEQASHLPATAHAQPGAPVHEPSSDPYTMEPSAPTTHEDPAVFGQPGADWSVAPDSAPPTDIAAHDQVATDHPIGADHLAAADHPMAEVAPTAHNPQQAAAASDEATTPAVDEDAARLADQWRSLATGQRAAIEWAMDANAGTDDAAATGRTDEFTAGPVSAAALADLNGNGFAPGHHSSN